MSSAHWVTHLIFWLITFTGIPLGIFICRLWRPAMYIVFALLVIGTFSQEWGITYLSRESYKAATRGFEIHISDLMALILLGGMLTRPTEFRFRWFPPLMGIYTLFFCYAVVSWYYADHSIFINFEEHLPLRNLPFFEPGLYPLFEMSKMLRGILIFLVVYNFCNNRESIQVLLSSLSLLIIVVTLLGLIARYVHGEHRIGVGNFHPNDLNSYVGLMGMFIFPFAYTSRRWSRSVFYWMVVCAAFLTIVLTVSRSSFAGFFVGGFITTCFCIARYPTTRNLTMIVIGVILGCAVLAKASDVLLERFVGGGSTQGAFDVRRNLNEAAVLMANDHVFGVGLGNFSVWSIRKYAEKAMAERYNIAHNVFYLTLAELGYFGLVR